MGVLMNITELPSPELDYFYHVFEYGMLVVTVIVVSCTLAVMLITSSKGLSKYRFYIIHGILWGFVFDAMSTFIGAVTLFPLPCYYGINIAGLIAGNSQLVYFLIGFNCAIGKVFAVFLQFEHRFHQALPLHSWYRTKLAFLHGEHEVRFRVGIYWIAVITINTPLFVSSPNQEEQRLLLSNLDPVLADIYRDHPSTICFSSGTESWVVRVTVVWIIILVVAQVFLLLFIYSSIHRLKLSVTTYRLQIMLFWSLVAQMGALFVFIMAPGLVYLGGAAFGMRNMPKISVFCFCFFISHTTVDSLMVLFFIKPYRRTLLLNLGCVFKAALRPHPRTISVVSTTDFKLIS